MRWLVLAVLCGGLGSAAAAPLEAWEDEEWEATWSADPSPGLLEQVLSLTPAEWADLRAGLEAAGRLEAPPQPTPEGIVADDRAVRAVQPRVLARARAALRAGDAVAALDALEPLRDSVAWPELAPFHTEAADAWLRGERQRLGAAYLRARELPETRRREAVTAIRAELRALAAAYPEASMAEALTADGERLARDLR